MHTAILDRDAGFSPFTRDSQFRCPRPVSFISKCSCNGMFAAYLRGSCMIQGAPAGTDAEVHPQTACMHPHTPLLENCWESLAVPSRWIVPVTCKVLVSVCIACCSCSMLLNASKAMAVHGLVNIDVDTCTLVSTKEPACDCTSMPPPNLVQSAAYF